MVIYSVKRSMYSEIHTPMSTTLPKRAVFKRLHLHYGGSGISRASVGICAASAKICISERPSWRNRCMRQQPPRRSAWCATPSGVRRPLDLMDHMDEKTLHEIHRAANLVAVTVKG